MPKVKKIIAAGFSFSGASAVHDFLIDHKGVVALPGGETRIFSSKRSLMALVKKAKVSVTPADIEDAREVLLGKIAVSSDDDRRVARCAKGLVNSMGQDYISRVDELCEAVGRNPDQLQAVRLACRAFTSGVCDDYAKIAGAHTVVLDQGTRPWALDRLSLYDEVVTIVVRRDIRDQVLERMRHNIENTDFVTVMESRLKKLAARAAKARQKSPIHVIWFEDFILRRKTRAKILALTGLHATPKEGDLFNPIASRKNVNLYRQRPDLIQGQRFPGHMLYARPNAIRRKIDHTLDYWEFSRSAEANRAGRIRSTIDLADVPKG